MATVPFTGAATRSTGLTLYYGLNLLGLRTAWIPGQYNSRAEPTGAPVAPPSHHLKTRSLNTPSSSISLGNEGLGLRDGVALDLRPRSSRGPQPQTLEALELFQARRASTEDDACGHGTATWHPVVGQLGACGGPVDVGLQHCRRT